MSVPKPCLDCGTLTIGSRCYRCAQARERARNAQPKRRAYLVPEYRAQPKVGVCHICMKPGADTRDHVVPIAVQMRKWGEVRDHRTKPAHRSCNARRGSEKFKAAPPTNPRSPFRTLTGDR